MLSYSVGGNGLLFVESVMFTKQVRTFLDDETYREFQNELAGNPEKGSVMQGCGGLRKARVEEPRRGKGKRGGCRIIYLHIPEVNRIDLLAVYSKDQQDDLNDGERKRMTALAERARREALARRPARKG